MTSEKKHGAGGSADRKAAGNRKIGNEKKDTNRSYKNAANKDSASNLRPDRPDSRKHRPKTASAVSPASAEDVRVGDTIVVTVKRIGINGEGLGYYRRKAVFIKGALPEEVVKAAVTKAEPGYLTAEIKQLEKKSPLRIQPACSVYETCGGCQLQHMSYEGQLRAKEELVREAFARYTKRDNIPVRPIIGMDDPWGYRNKAQLQVATRDGRVLTGLYEAGTHRFVDIAGCPIQHPGINSVMQTVSGIVQKLGIPIYNERTKRGALRMVVARVGTESGDVQLTFITAGNELPNADKLVARVRETLPSVKSIAHNINRENTPLVFGETTNILWGGERISEKLGDVELSLSPRAFFQLNPQQTLRLYDAVKEAAALTGRELVVDAYCGTGTIALWLAPFAGEVRGIEVIADAVLDARRNAELSGASRVSFYTGRAEQLLPEWVRAGIRPDVIVVDPPRTGCDRKLLDAIAAAKPKRLVYVSCNPSTLAKDCAVLLDAGFLIEWVQPVDMFPQTSHVESVALINLRG